MEPTSRLRLENIQALRAIAAFLVLGLHTFNRAVAYGGGPSVAQIKTVMHALGPGGVDIFFVISGFIIVWVAHRAVGDSRPFSRSGLKAALTFAFHRAARILPLFWIALAAMVILALIYGRSGPWHRLLAEPSGLLLLTAPAAHPVSWTLVFEMHFYAVAAFLILFAGRWVAIALGVWGLAHVALVMILMSASAAPYSFFQPISIDFVLGVALAVSMIRTSSRTAPLVVWGAAAASVGGAVLWSGRMDYSEQLTRVLVWGVPTMGVLYGLILLETVRGVVLPAWLRHCGDWSYSLYLWHLPVLIALGMMVQALGRTGTFAGGAGYVMLGVVLCLVVSALSHRFVESPIMRWASRTRFPAAPAIHDTTLPTGKKATL